MKKYIAKQDFINGTWIEVKEGEELELRGKYLFNKDGKCVCGINSTTYDNYIKEISEK